MAETTHSVNTTQGQFDVIRYSNGAEHMYSVDGGKKSHVSHEKVVEAHRDPELEEQASNIGDVALDAAVDTPEQAKKQEVRTGEKAIWHSKKAGKDGNNDLKVTVGEILEEKNGVVYVNIVTENGTNYKTRADRLEYQGTPTAEGAAEAHRIANDMAAEADAIDKRLDQILPPGEKKEKTIEEQLEELSRKVDRDYQEIRRLLREMNAPNDGNTKPKESAAEILKAGSAKPDGEGKAEDSHRQSKGNKEVGDKIGDAGEWEIRRQLDDGTPVIVRKKNGKWEYSRNGSLAESWFEADAQIRKTLLGFDPEGEEEKNGLPKSEAKEVFLFDADAADESMKKIEDIHKEMSENPTPERLQELIKELGEEHAKLKQGLEAIPEAVDDETEVTVITPAEAQQNSLQRFRNRFRDAYNRFRGIPAPEAAAAAAVAEADSSGGGGPDGPRRITVVEDGAPTPERSRRRRLARGVLGAAALVGAGVAGYYLARSGHSPDIVNNYKTVINDFCHGHASGIGPDHIPKGAGEHLKTHFEQLRIHNGSWHDTIWSHVSHETPSGGNVQANVQKVLDLNADHIRQYAHPGENLWQVAHHLPEHFKFKVPSHF